MDRPGVAATAHRPFGTMERLAPRVRAWRTGTGDESIRVSPSRPRCATALLAAVALAMLAVPSARAQSTSPPTVTDGSAADSPTPAALLARARRLMEAGQPDEARPVLRAALAGADTAGDHGVASLAEVALGRVGTMAADGSAEQWFARAEARARTHGLERTLGFVSSLRANALYERGDVVRAEALYVEAIPHFERAGAFDELANTRRALAVIEPPERGVTTLAQALADARRARSTLLEGQVLLGMGDLLFVLGRWDDAYARVREAMPLLDQVAVALDQARARISLARLHRMHGDRPAAREQYARADALLTPIARGIGLSNAWSNVSAGWRYVGESSRAEAAARRALALAERSGNARDRTFATLALVEVLLASRRESQVEEAIGAVTPSGPAARTLVIRRAFALARVGRPADALGVAAEADRYERSWMEAQPGDLAILAEIHRRAARPTVALGFARQAVQVLEDLRGNAAAADMLRVGFDDGFHWVHGRLVRLLAETSAPAEALAAAERARARAFADVLADRQIAPVVDQSHAVAPAEVSRTLGHPVVAYWTDDEGVLIWVVAPDGRVTLRTVAVSASRLGDLVARTWSAREPAPRAGRATAPQQLYDLLVRPVRQAWPAGPAARVAIVPHGPLFRLSFAGLMDERGRYLVEQVSTIYAPSFATFASLTGRTAAPLIGSSLVVAVPETTVRPGGVALPPIPGALAEARASARRMSPGATVLDGAAATEHAVRARLGEASLLHFAAHAVVSDEQPMESFLALTTGGAADADGRLTAAEVHGLSLRARLAVLSGCGTASGRVTGDGVAGLSRAFFSAGVPTLVASLWDLPDVAGRVMLPAFYEAWTGRTDAPDALRAAQLRLLRDLRAGRVAERTSAGPIVVSEHPAVWANLVVMGAP